LAGLDGGEGCVQLAQTVLSPLDDRLLAVLAHGGRRRNRIGHGVGGRALFDFLDHDAKLADQPADGFLVETHFDERAHHLLAVVHDARFERFLLGARGGGLDVAKVVVGLAELANLGHEGDDALFFGLFVGLGLVVFFALFFFGDVRHAVFAATQIVAELQDLAHQSR
jgi:hypothetical protein